MMRQDLDVLSARPGLTLLEALAVIDRGALGICCIVESDAVLQAVLTDGDVRRALLNGAATDAPAMPYASTAPHTVGSGTPRAHVLALMQALRIGAVPEVDSTGRLVGLHTLSDIVGATTLRNPAVIMAGGKGTRLSGVVTDMPKPLVSVAGRPVIEWIILNLVGGGVRDIWISVHHLADQIVDRLGDGSHLGCRLRYLREPAERALGTAGSLSLLPSALKAPHSPAILVVNGDLMVDFDVRALLAHHETEGAALTMATRGYTHTVPFGVIETELRRVRKIEEKPTLMVEINAAIYCLDPIVAGRVETGVPLTMPQLVQECLDEQLPVSAWPLESDWVDIGTPADLARARGEEI